MPESMAAKNWDVTKKTKILALLREVASMTATEMAQKLSVNRRTIQRELEKKYEKINSLAHFLISQNFYIYNRLQIFAKIS